MAHLIKEELRPNFGHVITEMQTALEKNDYVNFARGYHDSIDLTQGTPAAEKVIALHEEMELIKEGDENAAMTVVTKLRTIEEWLRDLAELESVMEDS